MYIYFHIETILYLISVNTIILLLFVCSFQDHAKFLSLHRFLLFLLGSWLGPHLLRFPFSRILKLRNWEFTHRRIFYLLCLRDHWWFFRSSFGQDLERNSFYLLLIMQSVRNLGYCGSQNLLIHLLGGNPSFFFGSQNTDLHHCIQLFPFPLRIGFLLRMLWMGKFLIQCKQMSMGYLRS